MLGLEIVEGPHCIFVPGGVLNRDEDGGWIKNKASWTSLIIAPDLQSHHWTSGWDDDSVESYVPSSSASTSEWDSERDIQTSDLSSEDEDGTRQLTSDEVIERWRAFRYLGEQDSE